MPFFDKNTYFTGQRLQDDGQVPCTRCGLPVNPRSTGWFDNYQRVIPESGSYVHFRCLSQQRLDELADHFEIKKRDHA